MSKFAQLLLMSTAFAPVLLTYAVVSVLNNNCCHAAWFLAICAALVLLCDLLLHFAKTRLEPISFRTATVETADHEVFGLLLIYILPLITRDLSTYNWHVWIVVSILFCLIVAIGYGYHFNPLLVLFGYHFYKVTETGCVSHILITQRRIYKTGETLQVGRLAEYILIEKRRPS